MKKILLIAICMVASLTTYAQVGIGTTTPAPSAILDLTSTNQALLLPRVANTAAIATPVNGMLIYDMSSNCFKTFQNGAWTGCIAFILSSTNGTAVVSAYVCDTASAGTMIGGTAVSGVTQTITANVTTVGTYNISTTAYGVTFAGSGTFAGTGNQNIELTATGTPTAAGSNTFTLNTIPNCSFNRTTVAPNGVIAGNTACATATISLWGCASVPGATLNDDSATAEGIEYDWTGATGFIASNTTTRALVEIAGQCWYRINADRIPTAGQPAWVNNTDVSWNGYYTSGPYTNEGRLYQWSAAMNASTTERAQGICATGFHVPSDCEWMYLENAMGMTTTDQQLDNTYRDNPGSGTGTGSHLSTLTAGTTNKSGFSALLAGFRDINGPFYGRSSYGDWWSSSESGASNAFSRILYTGARGVNRNAFSRAYGFSVRCLKD